MMKKAYLTISLQVNYITGIVHVYRDYTENPLRRKDSYLMSTYHCSNEREAQKCAKGFELEYRLDNMKQIGINRGRR